MELFSLVDLTFMCFSHACWWWCEYFDLHLTTVIKRFLKICPKSHWRLYKTCWTRVSLLRGIKKPENFISCDVIKLKDYFSLRGGLWTIETSSRVVEHDTNDITSLKLFCYNYYHVDEKCFYSYVYHHPQLFIMQHTSVSSEVFPK